MRKIMSLVFVVMFLAVFSFATGCKKTEEAAPPAAEQKATEQAPAPAAEGEKKAAEGEEKAAEGEEKKAPEGEEKAPEEAPAPKKE